MHVIQRKGWVEREDCFGFSLFMGGFLLPVTLRVCLYNDAYMWNANVSPRLSMQFAEPRSSGRCWFIIAWSLVLQIPGLGLAGELVTLASVVDPGQITACEPFADVFWRSSKSIMPRGDQKRPTGGEQELPRTEAVEE